MKILWMSNSPYLSTGYGIQTANICSYLNQEHEVKILGLQQQGAKVEYNDVEVLPIFESTWGKKALPYWLNQFEPDILITLMDIWVKPDLIRIASKVNFVPYLPVDSSPLPYNSEKILNAATFIIPFSKFTESLIKESGFTNEYRVPHGIDTEQFRPLDNKQEIRRNFEDKYDTDVPLEDKFIISSVAMNKGFRKGFDRLMKGFKIAQQEHNDMLLWLHTDPTMKAGMPLLSYAQQIGLDVGRDVIFSPECGTGRYWSEDELNKLYNLSDIHTVTSMGEGYALPIMESMSTGTPNCYSDMCTANEFLGDNERGLKIPIVTEWMTPLASNQFLVDIDEVANSFITYYEDRELLKKDGKKSREFAKNYDWENIYPEWDEALDMIQELI